MMGSLLGELHSSPPSDFVLLLFVLLLFLFDFYAVIIYIYHIVARCLTFVNSLEYII